MAPTFVTSAVAVLALAGAVRSLPAPGLCWDFGSFRGRSAHASLAALLAQGSVPAARGPLRRRAGRRGAPTTQASHSLRPAPAGRWPAAAAGPQDPGADQQDPGAERGCAPGRGPVLVRRLPLVSAEPLTRVPSPPCGAVDGAKPYPCAPGPLWDQHPTQGCFTQNAGGLAARLSQPPAADAPVQRADLRSTR